MVTAHNRGEKSNFPGKLSKLSEQKFPFFPQFAQKVSQGQNTSFHKDSEPSNCYMWLFQHRRFSLHSLLYDIPGSESFNSELAQSFPLAGEFWNNFSSALRFPLAFFNKLCRSCSFRVLEGILILCQLKTKSWEKHEHWNILMDDKGGRGWLHLHIS